MAFRTGAEIFANIFRLLADCSKNNRLTPHIAAPDYEPLAQKIWDQSQKYDFSPCQMEADEDLEFLGLAFPYKGDEGYTFHAYLGEECPFCEGEGKLVIDCDMGDCGHCKGAGKVGPGWEGS